MTSDSGVKTYLAGLPEDQRGALEQLRGLLRTMMPDATEVLSYGIPTFKRRKSIVAYGVAKQHCSFYVMSPGVIDAHRDALAGYSTAKGTVHFQPAVPLPEALVATLVQARLVEVEGSGR